MRDPIVRSIDETIEYIVDNRCSVSRYGDGEFLYFTRGINMGFQCPNEELCKRLREILISNEKNHIVCIPKVFGEHDLDYMNENGYNWWSRNLSVCRQEWYNVMDLNKVYYNTQFTRYYIDVKDRTVCKDYFENLKRIWANRSVLMVEGKQTRFGYGNDLFNGAKSVKRILCPAEHAFSKYESILEGVKRNYKDGDLVLIALGPTATVLAFDLSKLGIQAVDIGHADVEYEWFLRGVEYAIDLPFKYVNKGPGLNAQVADVTDVNYLNQIVDEII